MKIKLQVKKPHSGKNKIKTTEQIHKEILAEMEAERLNIQIVRDMAEQFWMLFDPPSQMVKHRKQMISWIATMNDALSSYWGEGATVTLDKCHKKFKCVGLDGRELWL